MSRPLRLEFPDALYHLTSRGDRRKDIYDDDEDRQAFLEVLSSVVEQFNWVCYAYCLMSNHYHLLVQTPDANLSKGMRQLNGIYTQAYNRRHKKTGHLFQGRYKSILVDEDNYLLELGRYIVLNPVKAGMVESAGQWKWSSYQATVGEGPAPEWLSSDYLLSQFSVQRKTAIRKYQEFVFQGMKNGPIWSQLNNQIYLGDKKFIDKVQCHMDGQNKDLQIPKIQKRAVAKSLTEYEGVAKSRDDAIVRAYASGGYSYQELGDYFGLHFTRIGKIVRIARAKSETRPPFLLSECAKYGFSEANFSGSGALQVEVLSTDQYRGFASFYEEALEMGSALVYYPNA
jgi:putative transposase